jgi:hypothetical protein
MNTQQTYYINSKMPLLVMGAMAIVCLLVIMPFAIANPVVGLLSGSTMLITLAASAYFSSVKLRSTKLCLDEAGLKKASVYGEYFVPWNEICRLTIKRNRNGRVTGITAIAKSGRRIGIAWYENMNSIADFMESHAKFLVPQNPMESLFSKPVVRWIVVGIMYTGFAFVIFGQKNLAIVRTGQILILTGILSAFWQYRQNAFSTVKSKAAWKYWLKTALTNLALAIGLTVVMVLILYIIVKIV